MAKTTQKGSSNKKATLRRPVVKTSVAEQAQMIAELRQQLVDSLERERTAVKGLQARDQQLAESLQREKATAEELEDCKRQLTEALEQQTATSEILQVIASSPTDIQPVLDVVAANAARLCGSDDAQIYRVESDLMRKVASYGAIPTARMVGETRPIVRGTVSGRAIIDRQTIHIPDMMMERDEDYPEARRIDEQMGIHTSLAVPLLHEGVAVGVILIRRVEVHPFTDKQIALLKIFADQAVIAIENVRLFNELKESLEQQTATSEILGVIAASPTDIQPVLDVVAENAARLCEASDAQIIRVEKDFIRPVAHYGTQPARSRDDKQLISRAVVTTRAITDRKTVHVHDLAAEVDTEFPESKRFQQRFGTRTILVTPLMREGVPIGAIFIRRTEVRPFSDKQIKLLETFADQAAILRHGCQDRCQIVWRTRNHAKDLACRSLLLQRSA